MMQCVYSLQKFIKDFTKYQNRGVEKFLTQINDKYLRRQNVKYPDWALYTIYITLLHKYIQLLSINTRSSLWLERSLEETRVESCNWERGERSLAEPLQPSTWRSLWLWNNSQAHWQA